MNEVQLEKNLKKTYEFKPSLITDLLQFDNFIHFKKADDKLILQGYQYVGVLCVKQIDSTEFDRFIEIKLKSNNSRNYVVKPLIGDMFQLVANVYQGQQQKQTKQLKSIIQINFEDVSTSLLSQGKLNTSQRQQRIYQSQINQVSSHILNSGQNQQNQNNQNKNQLIQSEFGTNNKKKNVQFQDDNQYQSMVQFQSQVKGVNINQNQQNGLNNGNNQQNQPELQNDYNGQIQNNNNSKIKGQSNENSFNQQQGAIKYQQQIKENDQTFNHTQKGGIQDLKSSLKQQQQPLLQNQAQSVNSAKFGENENLNSISQQLKLQQKESGYEINPSSEILEEQKKIEKVDDQFDLDSDDEQDIKTLNQAFLEKQSSNQQQQSLQFQKSQVLPSELKDCKKQSSKNEQNDTEEIFQETQADPEYLKKNNNAFKNESTKEQGETFSNNMKLENQELKNQNDQVANGNIDDLSEEEKQIYEQLVKQIELDKQSLQELQQNSKILEDQLEKYKIQQGSTNNHNYIQENNHLKQNNEKGAMTSQGFTIMHTILVAIISLLIGILFA
ncbi:hypothetical protein PPERSA_07522 [Pseudocohnilembus persalinus]|uniref:Transmembrane protein n=1 Tax=Pseudocohnilembus persalinus TaxID=266149 RepID=A0A0V0QZP7_PSEPJ|nr:hypothetical protein PPERSA_07522 [Pseudocohnilembus persalinus]|eukprot:KRX07772.1 hypothetical protein PPERSA_07522 [Pseudocohnilembus persalinus]